MGDVFASILRLPGTVRYPYWFWVARNPIVVLFGAIPLWETGQPERETGPSRRVNPAPVEFRPPRSCRSLPRPRGHFPCARFPHQACAGSVIPFEGQAPSPAPHDGSRSAPSRGRVLAQALRSCAPPVRLPPPKGRDQGMDPPYGLVPGSRGAKILEAEPSLGTSRARSLGLSIPIGGSWLHGGRHVVAHPRLVSLQDRPQPTEKRGARLDERSPVRIERAASLCGGLESVELHVRIPTLFPRRRWVVPTSRAEDPSRRCPVLTVRSPIGPTHYWHDAQAGPLPPLVSLSSPST